MTSLQHDMQALINQLIRQGITYGEALRQFKKEYFVMVLTENNFNQCRAARELGKHRNTLNRTAHGLNININALKQEQRKPVRKARVQPVRIQQTA